ncbi:MAG: IclR family transcriptional regulator [Bauldia sp.]|nr:MAG: IclR family transcriptional regulator [Bauldia sp.]
MSAAAKPKTAAGAARPANAYVVQPVLKALRVLELVAGKGHEVSLTDVANELKIPKTTTFRYLQTLTEARFLRHDAARDRYGVGPRFRTLAAVDTSLQSLRTIARPVMTELCGKFNETINLAVVADGRVVYVDMIAANRSLRMQARIGEHHPMHSTALGKAILALLPEKERDAILAGPLVEMTSRTVVERPALLHQLRRARERCYAVETEENEDGAMCIGAPIVDNIGYPIAAISISAPKSRMNRDIVASASSALVAGAAAISQGLGGRFPV